MRVVIAHGRAAEMDIPEQMAGELGAALRYGLSRVDSALVGPNPPAPLDIELAYFGHLWRPDEYDVVPPIEITGAAPAVPGVAFGFADLSYWFDKHLGVANDLLDIALRDVDGYFMIPDLRAATNAIVERACTTGLAAHEPVVLVGFSMGSLVAYDLLRTNMLTAKAKPLPVAGLVTCGSPLALPSFYAKVRANASDLSQTTPFPSQIGAWVNVWTKDDPGAGGHDHLAELFPSPTPATRFVQDLETHGRGIAPLNPAAAHNAVDYLSSKMMAGAISQILLRAQV